VVAFADYPYSWEAGTLWFNAQQQELILEKGLRVSEKDNEIRNVSGVCIL
jgi:hypothetical protein